MYSVKPMKTHNYCEVFFIYKQLKLRKVKIVKGFTIIVNLLSLKTKLFLFLSAYDPAVFSKTKPLIYDKKGYEKI